MQNPWKKLSSKQLHKTPWLSLIEDQVIRPDGKQDTYTYIQTNLAVAVVALNQKNEIYLVGQYRYPTDGYSWEIIEGGGEKGETGLDTAKRELKEEAGLTANKWTKLGGDLHLSNCISSEVGEIYLAEELTIGEADPEPTEILTIKTVDLDSAMKMLLSGEITDTLTEVALYRLKAHLEERNGCN